jgi:2'-5' RNA ligase
MQKYFIAILPPEDLSGEITSFRKKYLNGLNEKEEHKKFPHITLQHTFSRQEVIEKEIHPYLISLAESFESFEIKLSGIGHFDQRVIFIGVKDNPVLTKLHLDLKNILMTKIGFRQNEVSEKYKPHITLEKKIGKDDFNFHWEKMKDKKFEGKFRCKSFSLMKHNGRIWEEVEKFDLKIC